MHPTVELDRFKANWIWTTEELPPLNQYVYFRKTFAVTDQPKCILCRITAERFYNLWVNDHFVGEGPAFGHPENKSFDTHDVTAVMSSGENVVAVLVYFDNLEGLGLKDGIHSPLFVEPTRAGLLCELRGTLSDGKGFALGTDGTWRTKRAQAWMAEAHFMNDTNFQEVYSLGIDPEDWTQASFNDADWPPASVIGSADGTAPDGTQLPWRKLVPRDIPFLEHKVHLPREIRTGEVIETMSGSYRNDPGIKMSLEPILPLKKAGVEGEKTLLNEPNEGFCLLQNSDPYEPLATFDGVHCATIIIDFGQIMNARLCIDVEGQKRAVFDIGYGPDLIEGRVMPYRSFRTSWADRLGLGGKRRSWHSFGWRQFRYVQITVRGATGPVKLFAVKAESVTYPFETTATFRCSDEELEELWKASERTTTLYTSDLFKEMPREGGFIGRNYTVDDCFNLLGVAASYGDAPICHRYLRQLRYGQLDNGRFMDCCPGRSDPSKALLEAGFHHVDRVWEHFEAFGEKDFLKEHFPSIKRHLAFWKGLVNSRGMLEVEPIKREVPDWGMFPWFDWALMDRRGEHLLLNAFYLLNLREATSMAGALKLNEDAKPYKEEASIIEKHLRAEFWDDEKGLFVDALVDGKRSEISSEHSQGMMMYVGLATEEQARRVVETWRRTPESLPFADMPFLYYVVQGLSRCGYADFALELIRRRLRLFLRRGHGVFGEVYSGKAVTVSGIWRTMDSRQIGGGLGGWISWFLLQHIVGFQLLLGARGLVRLAPHVVADEVEVDWCGVRVKWRKQKEGWNLKADFAEDTGVEFVLPFKVEQVQELLINDEKQLPVKKVTCLKPCKKLEVYVKLTPDHA